MILINTKQKDLWNINIFIICICIHIIKILMFHKSFCLSIFFLTKSFVYDLHTTSSNKKMLKACFLGTTYIAISLACTYFQSHNNVLPVMTRLLLFILSLFHCHFSFFHYFIASHRKKMFCNVGYLN